MTHKVPAKMDEEFQPVSRFPAPSPFVLESWRLKSRHVHATSTPYVSLMHLKHGGSGHKHSFDSGLDPSPSWGSHQSFGPLNDTDSGSHPQLNLLSHFEDRSGHDESSDNLPELVRQRRKPLQKRRSLDDDKHLTPTKARRCSLDHLNFDSGCNIVTPSMMTTSSQSLLPSDLSHPLPDYPVATSTASISSGGIQQSFRPSVLEKSVDSESSVARSAEEYSSRHDSACVVSSSSISALSCFSHPLPECEEKRMCQKSSCSKDMPVLNSPCNTMVITTGRLTVPATIGLQIAVDLPVAVPASKLSKWQTFEEKFAIFKLKKDQEIGHRIGTEKVDILGELLRKNTSEVVKLLLGFISEEDLCSLCLVNSQWKAAVDFDVTARRRKQKFLEDNRKIYAETPQENRTQAKKPVRRRGFTGVNRPMAEIQLKEDVTPVKPAAITVPKSELFFKEARLLEKHEGLRKCPMCDSPAKANVNESRAKCTRDRCQFEFCIDCRMSLHVGKSCNTQIRNPRGPKIGSKQSKQNLRRL